MTVGYKAKSLASRGGEMISEEKKKARDCQGQGQVMRGNAGIGFLLEQI
jgi:hypothetical protein